MRVWNALRMTYGAQFTKAYGAEPNPVWMAAIANLSDTQCASGCAKLANETRPHPPNLPEFLDACKGRSAGVRYLGTPVAPDDAACLSVQPASPETVDSWLASIRGKLR